MTFKNKNALIQFPIRHEEAYDVNLKKAHEPQMVAEKGIKKEVQISLNLFFYNSIENDYFTLSKIALKASGLFIAKSARALRLRPISDLFNLPMNCE